MHEDRLVPENFDLEEFQRQVNYELVHNFQIELSQGEQVVTTVKYEKVSAKKKPPFFFPYSFLLEPISLVFMVVMLLLGFRLGGGSFLVPSLRRTIVGGISVLLIACAGYIVWKRWRTNKQMNQWLKKNEEQRKEKEAKKRIAQLQAGELLARNDIKAKLCPALQDFSNNVFDMSKSVASVLITLSATGVLSVTLTPLLVAAMTVALAKTGINAYCSGKATS